MMNRRDFLQGVVASAALPGLSIFQQNDAAGAISVSFTGNKAGPAIPENFVGLSYESAQLVNPAFFSSANRELVRLFVELAPRGVLRLGGGSSEYTTYSEEVPAGPPPFEVFGPDTSKTVKSGTITSALALHNLREFLDATKWDCLYGLNLGQGTVENAVREAKAAFSILGPRLIALQIGNEPDSFRNRYRPASYGPADFLAEWNRFHDAIASQVPGAKFAGPDISNKLPYLTAFAAEAPRHRDVVMLTGHYYAMGPAGSPGATLDNLLDPDPKLTTLKPRDVHIIQEACKEAQLPFRMSEGNSCWNGGQPGVSDTFASALWCAGYLLQCAQRGWVGVNLHGGGNGFYTAIAGTPSGGFMRRPEFFGIQFAQRFVGKRMLRATLIGANPRVDAFAFEQAGRHELVLVNKTPESVTCNLPAGVTASSFLRLQAPAIDAKDGAHLLSLHARHDRVAVAPAYTATAYQLKGALNA